MLQQSSRGDNSCRSIKPSKAVRNDGKSTERARRSIQRAEIMESVIDASQIEPIKISSELQTLTTELEMKQDFSRA